MGIMNKPVLAIFGCINKHSIKSTLSLCIFALSNVSAATSVSTANALPKVYPLQRDLTATESPTLFTNIGFMAGSENVLNNYYIDPVTIAIFSNQEPIREKLGSQVRPEPLPIVFENISKPLASYMSDVAADGVEQMNAISFDELAKKITRASFCFGLDPKMFVAMVQQESIFTRAAVSPTGAVGLTQMTGPGIGEVMDQLFGRAPEANHINFGNMSRCYLGSGFDLEEVLLQANGRPKSNQNIKRIIQQTADLDILFGHILLKLHLAIVNHRNMSQTYKTSFFRYNGSAISETYSRKVMNHFSEISKFTYIGQLRTR